MNLAFLRFLLTSVNYRKN